MEQRKYAEVVIDLPIQAVDRIYHYAVPETMRGRIAPGMRVRVSFGRRKETGYVVGFTAAPEVETVKEIIDIIDDQPLLTPDLLALAKWMAQYYLCTLADAIDCMLPAGLKQEKVKTKYTRTFVLTKPAEEINRLMLSMQQRAPKQAAVLAQLMNTYGYTAVELANAAGTTTATVQALVNKGLIMAKDVVQQRDPYAGRKFAPTTPLVPTAEQANALAVINAALHQVQPRPILLHGVTGSGKTEIYLQAIAKVLAMGKTAIVLVPEIALTPQTVARFKARFGDSVAVLHSRLAKGERYDEWKRVRSGAAKIAVGARSAVFAPFANLGLIIIDEEHETSYKQDCVPRYHARETAMQRAKLSGALLLLGSATPALESYQRAVDGAMQLVTLTKRVDAAQLPAVKLVDLREELKAGNKSIFSRELQHAITERLAKQEQVILFLNRRGYATFVLCRQCGLVMRCPRCDVSLTYHMDQSSLRCHYCDYTVRVPKKCPRCHSPYIKHFGVGTQKVEEEIKRLFPAARVLRMDVDTTGRKGDHERLLDQFQTHAADILIGTQMIAKGLDFPQVTLVGVITADTALNLPDFRAGERTFQLLTQVAGRAGRGKLAGEVIVQTYAPEHYSIVAASKHDYHAFYRDEIKERAALCYPPFSQIIRIVASGTDERRTIETIHKFASVLLAQANGSEVQILGPTPAPLARLRNTYRWQLALKGQDLTKLQELLHIGLDNSANLAKSDIGLSIDVDPLAML